MVMRSLSYVLVAIAAGAGVYAFTASDTIVIPRAEATQDFPFLNPVVSSDLNKHFIINFRPLRDQFTAIQAKYPQKTYIYFLYLNNASWVGLGERDEFTAASTIKVPLAMTLMKGVEDKKFSLDDHYGIEELDLDENFGDLYKAGANGEYTLRELLGIMLEQSDNTAQAAVTHIIKRVGIEDPLADVYGYLGWGTLDSFAAIGESPNYSKINLKTLSNLFITLYDAKYVDVEHSNLILEHLAQSPFTDKIDAGVPDSVVVSHKIGTAAPEDTYSDCGIVYAPNRHYLLCIGSVGADEKKAASFMAEISKAAYDYVIHN